MKVLFELLRIKQWVKNGFVILPFIFSQKWIPLAQNIWQGNFDFNLQDPELLQWLRTFIAFISFSFIASGIYILNDWIDREQDKIHPKKKFRPIPSGQVSFSFAFGMMIFLWTLGLTLPSLLFPHFNTTLVLLTYLVMNIAYSLKLKNFVILDVMCIAMGFVLRVFAGASAIEVRASFWLVLCTSMLALFLGFCKRRHECLSLEKEKKEHRQVLEHYSLQFLDQMISLVTACTLMSYILYTHDPETIKNFKTHNLYFTIPFVVYGILRYFYLVYHREEGGNPTEILYSDPGIITTCIFWLICVCIILLWPA